MSKKEMIKQNLIKLGKGNTMRNKILYIFLLTITFCFCSVKFELKNLQTELFHSEKGRKVKEIKWEKIKIGMDKNKVKRILKEPLGKIIVQLNDTFDYEYWEYEYTETGKILSTEKINFWYNKSKRKPYLEIISFKSHIVLKPTKKAYVIFFDYENKVVSLKKPRLEMKEIDKVKWNKLKIGLSRNQVFELLGSPLSKTKSLLGDIENGFEFWEYVFSNDFLSKIPEDNAYVVLFNKSGTLIYFREPSIINIKD